VSNVQHGQFELSSNPGKAVTNFTQQHVSHSEVQFAHDGSQTAPSYDVTVSDGRFTTAPATATMQFTLTPFSSTVSSSSGMSGSDTATNSTTSTLSSSTGSLSASSSLTLDPSSTAPESSSTSSTGGEAATENASLALLLGATIGGLVGLMALAGGIYYCRRSNASSPRLVRDEKDESSQELATRQPPESSTTILSGVTVAIQEEKILSAKTPRGATGFSFFNRGPTDCARLVGLFEQYASKRKQIAELEQQPTDTSTLGKKRKTEKNEKYVETYEHELSGIKEKISKLLVKVIATNEISTWDGMELAQHQVGMAEPVLFHLLAIAPDLLMEFFYSDKEKLKENLDVCQIKNLRGDTLLHHALEKLSSSTPFKDDYHRGKTDSLKQIMKKLLQENNGKLLMIKNKNGEAPLSVCVRKELSEELEQLLRLSSKPIIKEALETLQKTHASLGQQYDAEKKKYDLIKAKLEGALNKNGHHRLAESTSTLASPLEEKRAAPTQFFLSIPVANSDTPDGGSHSRTSSLTPLSTAQPSL
jgi:hypothetical protein